MKPENKRALPEIELAVLFIILVLVVQLCILVVVIWNGYQDRKLIENAQRSSMQYRQLHDQHQHMLKQSADIKVSMDAITNDMSVMNRLCKNSITSQNSGKLNSLKQNILAQKNNLEGLVPSLKTHFGDEASASLQKYVTQLQKESEGKDCAAGVFSATQWKQNAMDVNDKLTESIVRVSKVLSDVLHKVPEKSH